MGNDERTNDSAVKAAKSASVQRLLDKLDTAHRQGTLRPVNPNAKPHCEEVRVKSASAD